MDQAAVGQLPQPGHAFVNGMVAAEILALEVCPALPPVVHPDKVGPHIVCRAAADHQGIPRYAAGGVNQGRRGRPLGVVQHGLV